MDAPRRPSSICLEDRMPTLVLPAPDPTPEVLPPDPGEPATRLAFRQTNPFTLLADLIAESLKEKLGEQASTLLAGVFGTTAKAEPSMTICRLTKLFLKHCETYYVFEDGSP